jgi:hypothetical protein
MGDMVEELGESHGDLNKMHVGFEKRINYTTASTGINHRKIRRCFYNNSDAFVCT